MEGMDEPGYHTPAFRRFTSDGFCDKATKKRRMKNLILKALYGPNWREDMATDDETMADGWAGRIILLSVLYSFCGGRIEEVRRLPDAEKET